jgi:hypothetical protein
VGCRKNVARLTPAERTAFVNAVLALKADGRYDPYVAQHQGAGSHGHGGPAFFPWHREYLIRFENDLQSVDPSVNIPYWDWTAENLNSAGTESLIWRADFMGGPGSGPNFTVTTGPFAAWGIRRSNFNIFGFPGGGGLITPRMAELRYGNFRLIEGPHGSAHTWVGGDVGFAPTAVRDPVFWLIHANVDRLWAEWTNSHRSDPGWVQYEPNGGGPTGHNLNDTMWPWNGTTFPFGVAPWTTSPEMRHPADLLEHRDHDTLYDTIDPECRPKGRLLRKELIKEKEFLKERIREEFKEMLAKELQKDRQPKELIKEDEKPLLKERGPKELKDIREGAKLVAREEIDPGIFIPRELRPDLSRAALGFEPDLAAQLAELDLRARNLGGPIP